MPRQTRNAKKLIYVFCEGESEQVYTKFLKETFQNVAIINYPSATGLFDDAKSKFEKDKKYKSKAEVTDEIWFFFDIERTDVDKWEKRFKIIKELRKLRKDAKIKVRLLMTTACIEYWLMLHYKKFSPCIETVAQKESMLAEIVKKVPEYEKGDYNSTAKIAINYTTAVVNAQGVFRSLLQDGLPSLEDTDQRNEWLYKSSKTFSTVFEAIQFLESLSN